MILLTNEDVEPLLKMPDCIEAIEAAFADLGNDDAVDIPRQDAIVPIGRDGAVHDLKTMSGTWPKAGIAAIRLNSDIVTGSVVNGTSRRVKLALSEPGGRYNGQVLLFSTDTGQLLCIVNALASAPPAASPRNISRAPMRRSWVCSAPGSRPAASSKPCAPCARSRR
jgi:ornithine cyclodeaminase/alanine dehydrogenase-like protein (mu-crystallin family)